MFSFFPHHFSKGSNFYDFILFKWTMMFFQNGIYPLRKEFASGEQTLSLKSWSEIEGRQDIKHQISFPWKCSHWPWSYIQFSHITFWLTFFVHNSYHVIIITPFTDGRLAQTTHPCKWHFKKICSNILRGRKCLQHTTILYWWKIWNEVWYCWIVRIYHEWIILHVFCPCLQGEKFFLALIFFLWLLWFLVDNEAVPKLRLNLKERLCSFMEQIFLWTLCRNGREGHLW